MVYASGVTLRNTNFPSSSLTTRRDPGFSSSRAPAIGQESEVTNAREILAQGTLLLDLIRAQYPAAIAAVSVMERSIAGLVMTRSVGDDRAPQ